MRLIQLFTVRELQYTTECSDGCNEMYAGTVEISTSSIKLQYSKKTWQTNVITKSKADHQIYLSIDGFIVICITNVSSLHVQEV